MKTPTLHVFLIGLLLSLIYWRLVPHTHNYPYAAKEFYVGGRLLLAGQNPYDNAQLVAGCLRYAPEGQVMGTSQQPQLHLPGTLAALAVLAILPWRVFCAVQILGYAFCIPGIAFLCLALATPRSSPAALWAASLAIGVLPPVWQNMVIGQLAVPLVLCLLLAARAFQQGQTGRLGIFTFLALLKLTFALPLVFLFWKGNRAQRISMAVAVVLLGLLNLAAIQRIGVHRFLPAYRQEVRDSFAPGMMNDPRGPAAAIRTDIEVLIAPLCGAGTVEPVKLALALVLAAPLVSAYRRTRGVDLLALSALCTLALLFSYHRAYDSVLLVPGIVFAFSGWRGGRLPRPFLLLALSLGVCMALIGNHNLVDVLLRPFHTVQPPRLRAASVLLSYGVLAFGFLVPARPRADPLVTAGIRHAEPAASSA